MTQRLILLALLTALFAGCKTTQSQPTDTATRSEAREEYQNSTSLGSWIPRKTKKGSQPVVSDENGRRTLEQMRQDQMIRNMPKDAPSAR